MKKPIKIKDLNKQNKIRDLEKVTEKQLEQLEFSIGIEENINLLKKIFNKCDDIKEKRFKLDVQGERECMLYFLSGITNETTITDTIIKPLALKEKSDFPSLDAGILNLVENHLLINHGGQKVEKPVEAIKGILTGKALLLIDGYGHGYVLDVKKLPARTIEEPTTQTLVRGPREGFVENLKDNLGLVRKRIKTPDFKVEMKKIGHLTETDVAVCYIKNIVDPKVVEEVMVRLEAIEIDAIFDSSMVEQIIEDSAFSPFPQIGNSERPDAVASNLVEGRVCIFVDGSPFVLVVPQVLTDFLQASSDYYERFYFATAIRVLRYIAFGLALLGPSLYVAITTFHHEMIPTTLLISIAAARQGIPFPAVVEAFIMEVAFEALREAGVRLPKPVGQAVSIVGALIIGEAAVQAGLVSQIMVIVVAGTGIASFTIPAFNGGIAVRLLKIPVLLLASTLGLFGVSLAVLAISIHLSTLRSFGVPYLSPIAPMTLKDQRDVIFRAPIWWMVERPTFIAKNNVIRLRGKKMAPHEPTSGDDNEKNKNKETG
ncbi:spore germination protein [Alkalicella caledoniensis]|uniref:Spore germination protein n=1 Tax=Alkalicella caledoniensis TaxID=2731377 RepID=A0A7G9W756_ALKCA|nr:spore germination protein [Alkalicella caledoniensis]QNO14518.1 spore germination protein [Alkalicella caledoniensis]